MNTLKTSKRVTDARASAQRAKLDAQAEARQLALAAPARRTKEKRNTSDLLPRKRSRMTVARAIEDYLADHEGGNHSPKTIQWHTTALGLLRQFLEEERQITLLEEIDAPTISAWFAYLRATPGSYGRARSDRTVQTYARSARAFFHWLVRQELIERNPFEKVTFPKVGKPLIRLIEPEEFEQLLRACTPPGELGPLADRAAARNRAILWLLYDTGIRLSELCHLRLPDLDRKHGTIIVKGKGSKERRIALGNNCLRNLLYYLDHHRPDEAELAEWGSMGEDHLFLSETRLPLSTNGVSLLFKRIRVRAGITDKRISPHIFRHSFAVRFLTLAGDPFCLQELLGHEDMATVRYYMHLNDELLQSQKRKFSPGDHLPTRMPGPRETRKRGFQTKPRGK